jgi:hypothetical protein
VIGRLQGSKQQTAGQQTMAGKTCLPTGEFITLPVSLRSNIITPSTRIRNRSVDGQATTTTTFFATLQFVTHMIKISPTIHLYTM